MQGQQQQQKQALSELHLPFGVIQYLADRGITHLYAWQAEALQCGMKGNNLLYSAPTSGGKSMVAELLMVLRMEQFLPPNRLQRKRARIKSIFVVPYVSVVREKSEYLSQLLGSIGLTVRGYFGSERTVPLVAKNEHVAVCTMEKANSAINKMVEDGRMKELYCAVVDELHMIADKQRGLALESCMSRILQCCPNAQVIGMSATLGGLQQLSRWMRAELYQTQYRPVVLQEFLVSKNQIFQKTKEDEFELQREVELSSQSLVVHLVQEVVTEGHSVLVFCNTRNSCSSCAKMISQQLDRSSESVEKYQQRVVVLNQIIQEVGLDCGVAEDILGLISKGVGYHHAGLSREERSIVERGYRCGAIDVLCATSTLAAGVNLPARRVILRSIRYVDRTQYLQMVGRAGRTGQSKIGEAFVISESWDVSCQLMTEELPTINSCIQWDNEGKNCEIVDYLEKLLLENIANGVITTLQSVNPVLESTLFFYQMPSRVLYASVEQALQSLRQKKKLIGYQQFDKSTEAVLYAKPVGKAIYRSGLGISAGQKVHAEILQTSKEGWCLESYLQTIYIVLKCCQKLPLQISDWAKWNMRYQQLVRQSKSTATVAEKLQVSQQYIDQRMRLVGVKRCRRGDNNIQNVQDNDEDEEQKHVRFLNAACVNDFLGPKGTVKPQHMKEAWQVAEDWSCFAKEGSFTQGDVWRLMSEVEQYAGMSSILCDSLDWWMQGIVLGNLSLSAKAGASQPRLQQLLQIDSMKRTQAAALCEFGINTVVQLAGASLEEVEKALSFSLPKTAVEPKKGQLARLNVGVTGSIPMNILIRRQAEKLILNAKLHLKEINYQIELERLELEELLA